MAMASRGEPGQPANFLRAWTTPLEPLEDKGFWRKGGILSSFKRLVSRKVVQEPLASNSPAIAGSPVDRSRIHVQSRQVEQLRHSCSVPQLDTPSSCCPSDKKFSNLGPSATNAVSPRYRTNQTLHTTSVARPVFGHLGGTREQYSSSPPLDLFASDPAISPANHYTSFADLSPRRAVMQQVVGSSMRAEQLQAGASPLRRGWTPLPQDQLIIQPPSSRQGPQVIDVLQSLPEFTKLSAGAGVEVAAAALSGSNACANVNTAPAAPRASHSQGSGSHCATTWLAGLTAQTQPSTNAACPRQLKAATEGPAATAGDPAQAAGAGGSGLKLPVCPNLPLGMRRQLWSIQDYTGVTRLFKSSTSAVYKATCARSGLRVALKVYSLDRVPANLVHTLVREVRIHAELSHRAMLTLYGVFQEASRLVLVLERAARGDLYQVHRRMLGSRMSEAQLAGVVLAPLLDALVYLHARGVCHRDIKPQNLLLAEDWTLRLADFGTAINLTEERAVTRTGTSDYMAPEVERCPIKLLPHDNKHDASLAYTTAADIWSVGVLAFEMLCGFPPLSSANPYNEQQQQQGLPAGESPLRFPAFVSPGARDFIATCLAERPGDRPTAAQLLRHPWLKATLAAAARTSHTCQRHDST